MDGLELIVKHGHLHQRVEVILSVIAEGLEIGQFLANNGFAFGRGVDGHYPAKLGTSD
ncbi:MAG: hypothetical protein ACI8T1_005362 [Verrucomicrobiales bacterium]|jgi:hypothetical protein